VWTSTTKLKTIYNKAARRRQLNLKTYWTIQCSRMLKYNITDKQNSSLCSCLDFLSTMSPKTLSADAMKTSNIFSETLDQVWKVGILVCCYTIRYHIASRYIETEARCVLHSTVFERHVTGAYLRNSRQRANVCFYCLDISLLDRETITSYYVGRIAYMRC
jgi:hypothetical protein